MCKPRPSTLLEFRDSLDALLRPYIQDEIPLVQVIMDIQSMAESVFSGGEQPRKGIEAAMLEGMNRIETIKCQCDREFQINYPWQTKQGQMMLDFLASRPETESVELFARWWKEEDWRGKQGQPPSLMQIQQFWPQAFKEQAAQLNFFHAEDK